jgi:hypothetical protein
MATLAGQRAQFTYWLNQYNLAEDEGRRVICLKGMAKYIKAAPANEFTVEEVTRGQNYPRAEVERYLNEPDDPSVENGLTEQEAISTADR